MKRAFWLLLLAAGCDLPKPQPIEAGPMPPPSKKWETTAFEISLKADKAEYAAGDTIRIEVTLKSTGAAMTLAEEDRSLFTALELSVSRHSTEVRMPLGFEPVGETLRVGEVRSAAVELSVDRLKLYCRPPAEGGAVPFTFHLRAPTLEKMDIVAARDDSALLQRMQELHKAYLKLLSTGEINITVKPDFGPPPATAAYVEVDLSFKPGTKVERIEAILREHGLHVQRNMQRFRVWLRFGDTVADAVKRLSELPEIESVDPV